MKTPSSRKPRSARSAKRPAAKAPKRASVTRRKSAAKATQPGTAAARGEATPGPCLSAAELAQLAREVPFLGDRADHLSQCDACAGALQVEMERLRAERYDRVPQALRLGYRPWWKQHRWWGALAFAVVAVGVALVLPPPAPLPSITLKGAGQAYATVLRQGLYVIDDAPLAHVGPLQPNDRVRLRIDSGMRRHVRVETHEPTGWQVLMDTLLPEDGWLPETLEITAEPRTQLRITTCVDAQNPDTCDTQIYAL